MRKVNILVSVMILVLLTGCNFLNHNAAPEARFICLSESPLVGLALEFSAEASSDKEDGKNVLMRWDFDGDGKYEIEFTAGLKVTQRVSHTYTKAGNYTVLLQVRDSKGEIGQVQKTINVGANTPPKASFSYDPPFPVTGQQVSFDASASHDAEDGQNLLARWDFNGDGKWEIDYSTGKKVTDIVDYTFTLPGSYLVKLEVQDSKGVIQALTENVNVFDAKTTAFLKGYVTESKGGTGIAQAKVSVSRTTGETVEVLTGEDGSFLLHIFPGVYQLTVKKDGFAVSRVQQLTLADGQEFQLELPLLKKVRADWPTVPAVIALANLSGTEAITPTSGYINFDIDCASPVGIKQVDVRFNHSSIDYDLQFPGTAHCTVDYDTLYLPDGLNYIKISVYDTNNNYTELYQPLYVENDLQQNQIESPVITQLQAITFGQSMELMKKKKELAETSLWKTTEDLKPLLRQADTTILTSVKWNMVDNAQGYRIYRSLDDDKAYRLIGTTTTTGYVDASADLEPGRKVYYRIVAFVGSTLSEPGVGVYTIPLEPFNVTLLMPANGGVVKQAKPTFTWKNSQLTGSKQTYRIVVRGVTDVVPTLNAMVQSKTSLECVSSSLENGKEYEWDIVEAMAYEEYTPVASAISYSSQGDGSINGSFSFTTQFE